MKTCYICKQTKQLSEFSPTEKRCKKCNNERVKKRYDREKQKEKYQKYREQNPLKARAKPAILRILKKVEIVTESGCWIFMGSTSHFGHGMIGDDNGSKKLVCVHRKTYEHFIGEIPSGLNVCHKCDVPSCCNPNHLFLGTHKDNMMDCTNKMRRPIGIKNHNAKVDKNVVQMIYECKKLGGNLKELSRSLPISYWQVCAIANNYRRKYGV